MTKIQLPFALAAPLGQTQLNGISELYGTYGILRIGVDPGGAGVTVEYDATRFSREDVQAALARAGFPLVRRSA